MKFLLETSDKNNLEQVNYFRVIHDVTLHSVTLENRSSSSPETSNTVTVYINGSAIDLDGDKTWADNGYYDLFSENSYTDYYNDSEESYRVETNGYPQEGDVYYTTCEYQANMVTVTINGEEKEVDSQKYWSDNGYDTLYTQNSYTDYYNDSEESYRVETNGYPQEGDVYYTTCEYQANMVTVTINGEEKEVDSQKYWSDNGYDTIYDVEDSMNECRSKNPSSDHKYSTYSITVSIDGENVSISPKYTFEEQGYDSIYGKDNCGSDIIDSITVYPSENWHYYTSSKITVTIDDVSVEVFPNLTFAEQGYPEAYKEVDGEDIDCASEYPVKGGEYWTT